jgi:predicted phage replisome organizer
MAEIKWIKIVTDIFNDEKIKLIEQMPEADSLLVIWFKILCLAGRTNKSGLLMMNDKIHYTDEMLSGLFNRPLNTVRLALDIFVKFEMIEIVNRAYYITNWEKHQNVETLDKVREQTRLRVSRYRQKLLTNNVTVTECNVTETQENKNKKEELEEELEIDKDIKTIVPYKKIMDSYNSICKSLPSIQKMTDSRKDKTKTRWAELKTLEAFQELFTKTEATPFCKGDNKSRWKVTFDWLIENDRNYLKVLEGAYNKQECNTKERETNGINQGNSKGFKDFE